MSGNHSTKSNDEERLLNAELLVEHWQNMYYAVEGKMESYKELMDAHAKELDRAMELLRRAEVEMRYAGWTKYESDNSARNGVYEQIVRFLK